MNGTNGIIIYRLIALMVVVVAVAVVVKEQLGSSSIELPAESKGW
jgi:uncharacterized membrane protein YczE